MPEVKEKDVNDTSPLENSGKRGNVGKRGIGTHDAQESGDTWWRSPVRSETRGFT